MNRSKLSYQGKKVFIGIDVHRSFFVMSAICDGELVKHGRISAGGDNTVDFIKKYFKGAQVETCYEAGFSGFWLHRYLEINGIRNKVIHAASVEISSRDRVKTDKRDSKKLATQLAAGRLNGICIPSEEQEQARMLTRTREQLVKSLSQVRNRIRMKLHLFDLLDNTDRRVLSRKMLKEVLAKELSVELRICLQTLLSNWEELLTSKRLLEKELRSRAADDPIQAIWLSLPGIGALSASILTYELGDLSQFPNERAAFSFTGLTPGEYSSGDNVRRGHISRQGSSRIRKILVEAAWRAIKEDPRLREDFERISSSRGKKRAIVAIARKLVGRARAVFRKGQEYKMGYPKVA